MAAKHGSKAVRDQHFGSEGRHRAPDQPGDTTTKTGEARRPGTRRKPSYKRTPVEIVMPAHPARERTREMPAVRATSTGRARVPVGESKGERRNRKAAVVAGEATEYARRAAIRASSGKPSTVGRAGAGAAAGAATGAALGSVVPVVGTAVGAGAGAVVGGVGGGVSGHKAKKSYKAAMRSPQSGSARKLLLAEFTVCATITALSPLTDAKRTEAPGDWMKRMTAVLGLFFILGIVSAAGRGGAKISAGLGGLVTVVLLVSERNLFVKLAEIFNRPSKPGISSSGGSVDHSGEMVTG